MSAGRRNAARPTSPATKVVIVGNGMAGARLADELRRREPDATALRITIIGEEPHPSYNRVLLSTVVAGGLGVEAVQLYPAGWHWRHGVELHSGVCAVAIDRRRRRVHTDDGATHRYDVLVLATGSRCWIPPTAGLREPDGRPADGVVAFRTAADCEQILTTVPQPGAGNGAPGGVPGKRVVVLGGGLLGLEAARGLAGRGAEVTLLHPVGHLMERQLDPAAGRVLARTVRGLGVRVRLNVLATRYHPRHGVECNDGTFEPASLVVVAAGVRPETSLAREAGLAVGHGIEVDDELRSITDPRIRAIGECAEHRGKVHGLVHPAWQQAAVLADLLTGADPAARYTGSSAVTRLKARDIDLATMGQTGTGSEPDTGDLDAGDPDTATEVVRLEDAARGRYAKLVLRGEQVAGAIVLGCPEAAATVTQLYDSGAPVPSDRLGLLVGRPVAGTEPELPAAMLPARAVVCRCNTVTKGQLTTAWLGGARSVTALAAVTRAATGCGTCKETVAGLCSWLAESNGKPASGQGAGNEETVA